jgi:hypothetical protein
LSTKHDSLWFVSALRLLIFDATHKPGERGLRSAWRAGASLYRGLGRVDAAFPATSWAEALAWLGSVDKGRNIESIQFWGHGKWGAALIAEDVFSAAALGPTGTHAPALASIRERMLPEGRSLVWFRTCETLGARRGQDFAMQLGEQLGASVAGHTYVIAAFQSGLHGLRPGNQPRWSETEGLERGTAEAPEKAYWSSASAPNTIHFMNNTVPASWFDGAEQPSP